MTAALARASAALTRRPWTVAMALLLVASGLPAGARAVARPMTSVPESRLTR
jgi:hypothetical protein